MPIKKFKIAVVIAIIIKQSSRANLSDIFGCCRPTYGIVNNWMCLSVLCLTYKIKP